MSNAILQQRLSAPGQSSFPKHVPGDLVRPATGHMLRYVEFAEAVVAGDAVCGTLLETLNEFHANNIADAQTLTTTTATAFTVEVRNVKTGLITTQAVPRTGSIIHVLDGTGDQQFAIVDGVKSTKILAISDIQNGGAGWASALDIVTAGDSDIRYLSMGLCRKAGTGVATHGTLPILGFAQRDYASGDFGWIVADGFCMAKMLEGNGDISIGKGAVKSATAGSIRPMYYFASETKNWDELADADSDIEEVTCTGALAGDYAQVNMSTIGVNELGISAHVSDDNDVQVVLSNNSGGALDLDSGTLAVMVTAAQRATDVECATILSTTTTGQLAGILAKCGYMGGSQAPLIYKDE